MKTFYLFFLLIFSYPSAAQTSEYIIVFLNKKTDGVSLPEDEQKKIMEGHMANIKRLSDEGKLMTAGPFEGGGGIFILKTASVEEAAQWISTDPGVTAGRWNIEILPYKPRQGSVCSVKEPITMTRYIFIRYDVIVSKFTASDYPLLVRKHEDYVSQVVVKSNLITEASFGDNEGGILILKENLPPELLESDPAVQQGLIELQIKKLYIPKGAFCEQ